MTRTCPRWYAQSPFVSSVMAYSRDYEQGRLGAVQKLPAALKDYLSIVEAERVEWRNEQEFRALERAKK